MDINQPKENKNAFFEYLLMISPNSEVKSEIRGIKHYFEEKYGCRNAAHSIPHITLLNFVQYKKMEFRIVENFLEFSKSVQPLQIELRDFGQFPKHTIYVNVLTEDPNAVDNIVKSLRKKFKHLLGSKPYFSQKAHLTIARELTEKQFNQAWEEWQGREFISSFNADKMILLKREISRANYRPIGNYKDIKDIKDFSFLGNIGPDEQLTLF